MRFGILVIGTVLVQAVQAQSPGIIRGTVTDESGGPVSNAQIVLTPSARRATSLDGGHFTIADVSAGVYVLSVRRIGYEPADVTLVLNDTVASLTIRLTAIPAELETIRIREKSSGIRYSAVVLDQFDVPVDGAEVVAMGVDNTLKTDALGGFTVPRLAPGTLAVRIRKMGYAVYFDSFRILAERADTIRMSRLAESLTPVEIKERSGYGNDEWVYRDLDQRTRWKGSTTGSISREELSQQGSANLCEVLRQARDANKFGLISPNQCAQTFYRVLVDGATCQTRALTDFVADQVEMIEYYPRPENSHILFTTSDASENLTRRGCPPEVFVIWRRKEVAATTPVVAAATMDGPKPDTAGQRAAPAPAESNAPASPVRYSNLQGQVVDSSGRPVRAAVVYTDEPPRAALSDTKGFFRLPALLAGPTMVRVQRRGFVGTEFQLRLPPDSTVGIGVRLMPAAPALGSVHVDSGANLAGRLVRVVSQDGTPILHASVSIDGASSQLTNEHGELSIGGGKRQAFTVRVLRIGYAPWFGNVTLPPAALVTVTLPRIALAPVVVTGEATPKSALERTGFYDRWEMRQKGALSAVFIGPEEIEFRHPTKVTRMLQGLNGLQLICTPVGDCTVYSTGQSSVQVGNGCPTAILLDGHQVYPPVNVDQLINVNDVAAIEVYARGGNMPVGLQANDTNCGVVAFWTGSRKP